MVPGAFNCQDKDEIPQVRCDGQDPATFALNFHHLQIIQFHFRLSDTFLRVHRNSTTFIKSGFLAGQVCGMFYTYFFPSVLWHCWLGDRNGIWHVKKLGVGLFNWWRREGHPVKTAPMLQRSPTVHVDMPKPSQDGVLDIIMSRIYITWIHKHTDIQTDKHIQLGWLCTVCLSAWCSVSFSAQIGYRYIMP